MDITQLQSQIEGLRKELNDLRDSSSFPYDIEYAIRLRLAANLIGTTSAGLTGILYGNGASALTALAPLSGTKIYYVADSSGGSVTRKLTFSTGVLISET